MDAKPQSPALSEERWHALLDDGIRAMEKLLARYEHDGRNFLDGAPRRLMPDLYYLGDIKGTAVYGYFASSKFFLVGAPGGSELLDFVNERLGKLGVKRTMPAAVLLTSSGQEDTSGLKELVESSGTHVVVTGEAVPEIKKHCPPETTIITAADLMTKGWFTVQSLPLSGRGETPVAYLITLGNKNVLFSGRIPVPINQAAAAGLYSDFLKSRGNRIDYRASLDQLEKLQPDLWLPAAPADGQNANLYDAEWQEIIANNRELLRNLK